MPITDIFKVGKFKDDLQKTQHENTVLKTTLAELGQMDAANLKAAISELEATKVRCAQEVQKAQDEFANKRRVLEAQLADLNRQITVKRKPHRS